MADEVTPMGEKSKKALRAVPRRVARERRAGRSVDQRAKELPIEDLAVTAIAALADRNQAISETDYRAGRRCCT